MSALTDAAEYADDPALVGPMKAALVRAAMEVSYEDPETEGHERRKAMATAVLANPAGLAATFAWATSSNATVVQKWTDDDFDGVHGDLAFVLSSVWNAVSGV